MGRHASGRHCGARRQSPPSPRPPESGCDQGPPTSYGRPGVGQESPVAVQVDPAAAATSISAIICQQLLATFSPAGLNPSDLSPSLLNVLCNLVPFHTL